MQVIMTKAFADKHGVTTFDDIAAKKPAMRLVLNKRGNIAHGVGEQMLQAIGVTPDDVRKWGGEVTLAASSEQTDLMKDRRADVLINSLFVKHGSLLELEQAVDVVLLPLSHNTIAKVSKEAGIKSFTIPAGSYKLQPNPVPTVTLSAGLIVNTSMDEKTAYNLTKALVEKIDKIKEVHKSMQALTPQLLASPIGVPAHPGGAFTILLGIPMPTPSVYLLGAVLIGPMLVNLGVPTMAAHMFILYYACLSAITPPVAVAAFAASAIARTNPLDIAIAACRLSVVTFVVPFVFVYSMGVLWIGSVSDILLDTACITAGAVLLAAAVEGYYKGEIAWWGRALLAAAACCLFIPRMSWAAIVAGVTLAAIAFFLSPGLRARNTTVTRTRPKTAKE